MGWVNVGAAAVSLYSANKKAKDQKKAADRAEGASDEAYARSLPWDVEGSFGKATFDEEGRALNLSLSKPWQSEYDIAMADPERQRAFISKMEGDPMAAGKSFYDMQKAIYAPEQERQRLSLESRLLAQGMLGSSGGAGRMEALRKAQAMQDLEAQYAGLDKAQGYIDTYRGRGTDSLGLAQDIGKLPQQYAETGQGIGSGMREAAFKNASTQAEAAASRGLSDTARRGSYISSLSSLGGAYSGGWNKAASGMFG